jgi:hypothetical protein
VSPPLSSLPDGFAATVLSLHRVAETLVAPARKPDNEIALEATPGGFGTPEFEFEGARQRVRVEGVELVREAGDEGRRAPLETLAGAGAILTGLLTPGTELDDEPLNVDAAASLALGDWYGFGDGVLGHLVSLASSAEAATPPRLWPEHFDIAIELGSEKLGTRASYGFSPGDENHAEPYLYVAPWTAEVSGPLWQSHGFRGAEMSYSEVLGASDRRRAAIDFFMARWDLLTIIGAGVE